MAAPRSASPNRSNPQGLVWMVRYPDTARLPSLIFSPSTRSSPFPTQLVAIPIPSVATPVPSAATPDHAVPELGRSQSRYCRPLELGRLLSDRVGRYPFPPCRLVIVSTPTAGSRVAAIRCCCCCCLPLSLLIGRRLAQQYQTR